MSGDGLTSAVWGFWVLVVLGLVGSVVSCDQWRYAVVLVALAPILTGRTALYDDVLSGSYAYQVPRYTRDPDDWHYALVSLPDIPRRGVRQVYKSPMLPLFRGQVDVTPRLELEKNTKGVRAVHTVQHTMFGVRGGICYTVPLINSLSQSCHRFVTVGLAVAMQYVNVLGRRGTAPTATEWTPQATRGREDRAIVFESDLPGDAVSMTLDGFKAGRYSLRLVREDVSGWDRVVREPEGNVVAVFTGYERIKTDAEGLARMADRWLEEGWRDLDQPLPETYFSPQVEARVASFWNLVPFARDRSTVNFALEVDGPIHVVVLPNDVVPVKALRIERVMTE